MADAYYAYEESETEKEKRTDLKKTISKHLKKPRNNWNRYLQLLNINIR